MGHPSGKCRWLKEGVIWQKSNRFFARAEVRSGFLDCRVKYPLLVTYPLSPSHLASSLTFSSFTATVTSLDLLFMLCVQGIEETVDSR